MDQIDLVLFALPDAGVDVLTGLMEMKELVNVQWIVTPSPRDEKNDLLLRSAREYGIEYYVTHSAEDGFLKIKLAQLKPLLVMVAGFDFKLPADLLRIPKLGFFNIHPSLLPEYRGGNPYYWVIANGEAETGVTLHQMDEQFDTGPILMQDRVAIHSREILGTLLLKLNLISREIAKQAVSEIYVNRDNLKVRRQTDKPRHYAPKIKDPDLRLDFNQPAAVVDRQVRAGIPYYLAESRLNDDVTIKFWETDFIDPPVSGIAPGTIKISNDRIVIGCLDNAVELKIIQIENVFIGTAQRALTLGLIHDNDRCAFPAATPEQMIPSDNHGKERQ